MKPENLTLFNQIENGMLTKGNTFVTEIFSRNLLKAVLNCKQQSQEQTVQEGF